MVSLIRKFYVGTPGTGGGLPPTPSRTPSNTPTPSRTPSHTPSNTPSRSVGASPSSTPSNTPSVTPSVTRTPSSTPSNSVTPTPTRTPSTTPSPTPSADCSSLGLFTQMQQAALQFMQTNIAYYKINLAQTKRNIYGESLEKWFYQPFLIKCTIERDNDVINNEMFGPDVTKNIKVTIPRMAWEQGNAGLIDGVNMLPEIGDIIYDRSTERYYELHNLITNYVPVNANISAGQSVCPQAELVTYNMECSQTRVSRLNLLPHKII